MIMKYKNVLLSLKIIFFTLMLLYLYFFLRNPLNKEYDSGLIGIFIAIYGLINVIIFRNHVILKFIFAIIGILIFIGIYIF